jgi:hypothetical protein
VAAWDDALHLICNLPLPVSKSWIDIENSLAVGIKHERAKTRNRINIFVLF